MRKALLFLSAIALTSCASSDVAFEPRTCSFDKDCGILSIHHHSAEFWVNNPPSK